MSPFRKSIVRVIVVSGVVGLTASAYFDYDERKDKLPFPPLEVKEVAVGGVYAGVLAIPFVATAELVLRAAQYFSH